MDHFIDAYRNYANFGGRATRTQFWMFMLFFVIVLIAALVLDSVVLGGPVLYFVVVLASFIPSLAIQIRRLHDTGRSGWWWLINFVPFGGIVLLVFFCQPSVGGNEWGEDQINEF